jgi:hypothetical protein
VYKHLFRISVRDLDPVQAALDALDQEGLQAPSKYDLDTIIRNGLLATGLFYSAMVLEPELSDLHDFFRDFIIRAVNRAPGVNDACTY